MTTKKFAGFIPANVTPVPDVLFDEIMQELTGGELKVLLYIIRRTYGFKKDTDAISLSQFLGGIKKGNGEVLDKGCGIHDRTALIKILRSLEEKGFIKRIKQKTVSGDDATTVYSIRFFGESESNEDTTQADSTEVGSRQTSTRVVGKHPLPGSGQIPTRVVGKYPPTRDSTTRDSETKDSETRERDDHPDTVPPTEGALAPTSSSSSEASSSTSSKRGMTPRFSSKDAAALYRAWVETYGEFGDRRFDLDAIEWIAAHGGTFMDMQFIYTRLKREKPERLLRPEIIKDHWGYLEERKNKQPAAQSAQKPGVTCMNEAARARYEQAMQLAQQKG